MEQNFTIEHQWKLYLKRVNLKEENLPEIQCIEMKRTFYGACGQMLILLRDDISSLPPQKAMEMLEKMTREIGEFWTRQPNKAN